MGCQALIVQRANYSSQPKTVSKDVDVTHPSQKELMWTVDDDDNGKISSNSRVLCMTCVVSNGRNEFGYLLEEMRLACGEFGNWVKFVIPGPVGGDPSVGKVFVEYEDAGVGCKCTRRFEWWGIQMDVWLDSGGGRLLSQHLFSRGDFRFRV
ncbi:OLC1v1035139C1 [Oldenlandia corymbosa var. corymbosa]|uniref:OLC1v1035139C1 n=1 Tax=Oldenlandia corymbosa var. corymbosa TaxID=529605 RepID=A0AAV1CT18_OLDCO|nr:OLC1v1035139C1 [Oldenlandia corymbosa var. corymbosa]